MASSTLALAPVRPRGVWTRWLGAVTLGETLGFAVPALVGAGAYAAGAPDAAVVPLATAAGAGEGAILGYAQSRVLRRELTGFDARDWIVATSWAAVLAWALGMSLGVYGGSLPTGVRIGAAVLVGIVVLLAVGCAQWLVLRRYVAGAWLWIPANAAAWLLGVGAVFVGTAFVDEGDAAALVAAVSVASGLAMAVVVAAVTGLALLRLLRPAPSGRPRPLRFLNGVVNPFVRAILRSPAHRPASSSLLLLTYTGRRTHRRRSLPVMYARDGDRLVVVAGQPERKQWWRNLRGGAPVEVRVRGRRRQGRARIATEPHELAAALALYRERFPRAATSLDASTRPVVVLIDLT